MVVPQKAVLDLVQAKVEAGNVIIERLTLLTKDHGRNLPQDALVLRCLLFVAVLHLLLEEVVHVHALVNVEEEGYFLGVVEGDKIQQLQLTASIDVLLVLLRL